MGRKAISNIEFIQKANEIHNNEYDYSFTNYINAATKIVINCNTHGNFEQRPDAHLRGSGCPACAFQRKSYSTSEYINAAIAVHKNRYDYTLTNYTRALTPIRIICKSHGLFNQYPNAHLRGHGCAKCAANNISITLRKSHAEFIEAANIRHKNEFDYSLTNYTRGDDEIIITCKIQVISN